MLCRKAGVPDADVRGPITSHRARSTIATQLYNAEEPMSLLALKEWLGTAASSRRSDMPRSRPRNSHRLTLMRATSSVTSRLPKCCSTGRRSKAEQLEEVKRMSSSTLDMATVPILLGSVSASYGLLALRLLRAGELDARPGARSQYAQPASSACSIPGTSACSTILMFTASSRLATSHRITPAGSARAVASSCR